LVIFGSKQFSNPDALDFTGFILKFFGKRKAVLKNQKPLVVTIELLN